VNPSHYQSRLIAGAILSSVEGGGEEAKRGVGFRGCVAVSLVECVPLNALALALFVLLALLVFIYRNGLFGKLVQAWLTAASSGDDNPSSSGMD
jgi:hypothetical protein